MSELQETMQIIGLSGEMAMKVGKAAIQAIQFIMQLKHSKYQKSLALEYGEMSLDKIQEKGRSTGDQVVLFQVATQDKDKLSEIKKELTERGISFSQLADFDVNDGLTQFYSLANDAAKLNAFFSRHAELEGQSISADDYYQTVPENIRDEVRDEVIEATRAARANGENTKKKEMEESLVNDPIVFTNENQLENIELETKFNKVLYEIPKTKGLYIVVPKDEIYEKDNKRLFTPGIDKEYSVVNKSGEYQETMTLESIMKAYKPDTYEQHNKRFEEQIKKDAKENVHNDKNTYSVNAQRLMNDEQYKNLTQQPGSREMTLNRETLLVGERQDSIMFYVPGSRRSMTVEIPKNHLREIDEGQTYVAVFNMKDNMNIRKNNVPINMSGEQLQRYFDKARENLHKSKISKGMVKKATLSKDKLL